MIQSGLNSKDNGIHVEKEENDTFKRKGGNNVLSKFKIKY